MKRLSLLVGAVVSLLPAVVLAQKPVEDKKAITFNEIERGLFFEGRGGFWATINPPAAAGSKSYFSPGQMAQIDIGFDIGERISPSLFLMAASNIMKSDYTGLGTAGTASGDYSALVPGAQVKVRLVGFNDSQDVKRLWLYVHGGAGVVFYSPASLLPTIDVLIAAGPGIEYFTRLRHFSIGVEANLNFHALTASIGFSIVPTVKYAIPF